MRIIAVSVRLVLLLPGRALAQPGCLCSNECQYPNDDICDDGGVGSDYSDCAIGSVLG